MNVLDALLGEHGVFYCLFDRIEDRLDNGAGTTELSALAEALRAALASHAQLEDQILFPALEPRIGSMGPIAVMRSEHTEIETLLDEACRAESADAAGAALRRILLVARDHFAKEEQVLFPMGRSALSLEELVELGRSWAETRQVTLGNLQSG